MTTATYDKAYFISQLQADTPELVRANYLKLSKQVHPDLHPGLGQEPMQLLNDAYETVMQGWDGREYKAPGYRDGKPVDDQTYTYSWEAEFEKLAMEIISYACTHPYTENIELVGAWVWVGGGNREGCPFRAPKKEQNASGQWVLAEGEVDNRPFWTSIDGTDTVLHFEWSKSNRRWYFDLRKLVSRNYDKKLRTKAGLDFARNKYGSRKFDKREETGVVRAG